MRKVLLAGLLLALTSWSAVAQTQSRVCYSLVVGGVLQCINVSAANPMPVAATITPSGTQDVNLTQVGGAAVALGQGLMAASIPVAIASNQSALTVAQATAASLNATVIGAGAAGTANSGVVTVQGIASMTPVQVSQATAASLNATVVGTGTFAVQVSGNSFTNITTNTDTNVKGSAGTLVGFTVNTLGTTSSVKFFNDADGTCSSGLVGTYTTLVQNYIEVPATMGTGICAQTAGAGAADITVFWR